MSRTFLTAVFLFILTSNLAGNEVIQIPMITYHTHAPFILEEGGGLTYDLAEYLNIKMKGNFVFDVQPMSRPEVDELIKSSIPVVVPWVNPAWFNDGDETIYTWTEGYILRDGFAFISRADSKLYFTGLESLTNLRFGGIRGHNYFFDELIECGLAARYDADNHYNNFMRLIAGYIDFCLTPLSSARYLIKQNKLEDKLFLSYDTSRDYTRKIMMSLDIANLSKQLDSVILEMDSDPLWQSYLEEYMDMKNYIWVQ